MTGFNKDFGWHPVCQIMTLPNPFFRQSIFQPNNFLANPFFWPAKGVLNKDPSVRFDRARLPPIKPNHEFGKVIIWWTQNWQRFSKSNLLRQEKSRFLWVEKKDIFSTFNFRILKKNKFLELIFLSSGEQTNKSLVSCRQ